MSMDPGMMAQMLAGQLGPQQQQTPGMVPQVSPLTAGADLARKAMLVNALRQQPQRPPMQPPAAIPGQIPMMQPQAQPVPGVQNA